MKKKPERFRACAPTPKKGWTHPRVSNWYPNVEMALKEFLNHWPTTRKIRIINQEGTTKMEFTLRDALEVVARAGLVLAVCLLSGLVNPQGHTQTYQAEVTGGNG